MCGTGVLKMKRILLLAVVLIIFQNIPAMSQPAPKQPGDDLLTEEREGGNINEGLNYSGQSKTQNKTIIRYSILAGVPVLTLF